MFSLGFTPLSSIAAETKRKCNSPGLIKVTNDVIFKCTKSKQGSYWKSLDSSRVIDLSWQKCEKPNQTFVLRDTNYICKKIRNRGLVLSKESINYDYMHSTDDGYFLPFTNLGPLSPDLDIPPQWIEFQNAYANWTKWNTPYRLKKYALGKNRPVSKLSLPQDYFPVDRCKIEDQSNDPFLRAFPKLGSEEEKRVRYKAFPNPQSVIQVVPIYASDTAKPTKTPEQEYSKYFNYVKDWIEYASDVNTNVQIRYPKEYFYFPKPIAPYEIAHDKPIWTFTGEVLQVIDKEIDFAGANMAVLVVPGGTSIEVIQQGFIGNWNTNEGTIVGGSSVYPDTYDTRKYAPNSKVKYRNVAHPSMWLHEFFHTGLPLDDHYGDQKNDINTEYGMGWWSVMGPPSGDPLTWEKWILGFITDNQVKCIDASKNSTTWIVPTSVKSKENKMMVIPLSSTKAIIIESIRAAGMYFKHPERSWGALTYVLDVTKEEHGQGFKLILPTNRSPDTNQLSFLSEAPLRSGESVTYENVKITIVESGTFGDVVKIEKN